MAIIRAARPQGNFYVLDKRISEDRQLSWAARGLLVYLLGKPDHWQVSVEALTRETEDSRIKTGRDGIYGLLKELESAGYIKRGEQRRDESGRMSSADYQVSEIPCTPDPYAVDPSSARTTLVSIEGKQGLKEAMLSPDDDPTPERKTDHEDSVAILGYLNEKTASRYMPVKTNLDLIKARMKEGVTVEDIKRVIDNRCDAWLTDKKMAEYLRPMTLFRASNFHNYLGMLGEDSGGVRSFGGR